MDRQKLAEACVRPPSSASGRNGGLRQGLGQACRGGDPGPMMKRGEEGSHRDLAPPKPAAASLGEKSTGPDVA